MPRSLSGTDLWPLSPGTVRRLFIFLLVSNLRELKFETCVRMSCLAEIGFKHLNVLLLFLLVEIVSHDAYRCSLTNMTL